MIEEKGVVISAGDHPPAVVPGDHMDDAILKLHGEAVLPTEIRYLFTFFPIFLSDGGAAVA